MDHTPMEGSWRSDPPPFPSSSSSSSKFRSHTVPNDYTFIHHPHTAHADSGPDEASSAWSSALPSLAGSMPSSSGREREDRPGSSSTWPRYSQPSSVGSRSSLTAYPYAGVYGHEKAGSTSSTVTAATATTTAPHGQFPGMGIPLVPLPPADVKGKGKAVERDDGDGEDMGVTGRIKVLAGVMDTSKGRDKVLKCGQYSMRTYLYLLSLILRVRPLSPWFKSNRKRVQQAVAGLSMTRKCLLLLNPLHPVADLLSPVPATASEIILHLIDLASAISDDLFCLSKLGLVSRRMGKKADLWSNRLWLLSTIIGLYRLHLTKLPKLHAKLRSLPEVSGSDGSVAKQRKEVVRGLKDGMWTNRKYLADLVFVSYDVFELTWFEEPIKCVAGLIAAFISTSKIYDSQWIASQGK